MATKLDFSMQGPAWPVISLPDWFAERAAPVIAALGEDHPESKLFRKILAAGKIEESDVDEMDEIMYKLGNPDAFMLAADLSNHAFTTIKVISLMVLCA